MVLLKQYQLKRKKSLIWINKARKVIFFYFFQKPILFSVLAFVLSQTTALSLRRAIGHPAKKGKSRESPGEQFTPFQ